MARRARKTAFSLKGALGLLIGVILAPAVLTISAGIVSLALWTDAADIVVGVLVICFAAMVLSGAIATLVIMRRWQRLARLQADFVANISHEVRTPLTAIRLFAETLRLDRVRDEDERRRVLDALVEESERLHMLLEQLLQWQRMSKGTEVYATQPQRVRDLVAGALSPWSAEAARSDLAQQVKVDVADDLPLVKVDAAAMTKAIQNLVDNAVKYGATSGVPQVRARLSAGGSRVAVEVLDRGPGIAAPEQKRIFDRFYRGEAVRGDPELPGTGLGLSIVNEVVRAHGGELRIESAVGEGSVFTILLPVANVAPTPTPDSAESEAAAPPSEGGLVQRLPGLESSDE